MTPDAQAERDAIVAWLRADAESWKIEGQNPVACLAILNAAKAIQRGDHLQPPPQ